MRRPGLQLGFAAWARRAVPPGQPADVARYFAERGVVYTREHWRKLLNGDVRAFNLDTWLRICDATGEPLSTFLSYLPAANSLPAARPQRRRRRATGRARARKPALPLPPAPRLKDFD